MYLRFLTQKDSAGVYSYPGNISKWSSTIEIGSYMYGTYAADSDNDIPAGCEVYSGDLYPPLDLTNFVRRFRTSDISPLIDESEWLNLINYDGADSDVTTLSKLVSTRDGWWDAENPLYSQRLNALLSENVIDSDTYDTFKHGIPRSLVGIF